MIDILTAVNNYLIANIPSLNSVNCRIEDASVFNDILSLENVNHCVIVGNGGGLINFKQSAEFGAYLFDWTVLINLFYYLDGDEIKRHEITLEAYEKEQEIILAFLNDSTLGGEVMDIRLQSIDAPFTYKRSDIGNYLMITMMFVVPENM